MSFKVLYLTATSAEAEALRRIKSLNSVAGGYSTGSIDIHLLVAGIGSISTAWNLKQWITQNGKPDIAVNAGIAGSFKDEYRIGDVVIPVNDCFADAGIEDGEKFYSLYEAGLSDPDEFPFRNGIIPADQAFIARFQHTLKPVNAITVNTSTGYEPSIRRLTGKFNPDIETMEGASFFYICVRENIPFFAVRAISNRIETRNRVNWNIPLAIEMLSKKLIEIFQILE